VPSIPTVVVPQFLIGQPPQPTQSSATAASPTDGSSAASGGLQSDADVDGNSNA